MKHEPKSQYFYFSVHDPDPAARSYGCVAESLDIALRKARWGGFQSTLLLEARPLAGIELAAVGRQHAEHNPLIGAEWLPLVDLIAANMNLRKPEIPWVLELARPDNPIDPDAPFAQARRELDGRIHAEVGPTYRVEEEGSQNGEILQMLGWSPPEHSDLPNFLMDFEPAISAEYIAGTLIQALTTVFGMTPEDGFFMNSVGGPPTVTEGIERIESDRRFILTEALYGISGRHKTTTDAIFRDAKAHHAALHDTR